jgi:methylated-DNA-protein-cysteine methyltransferase-like protein
MSKFKDLIIGFIKKVPKKKVVSYGQVAAACGSPRAARQVGGILRAADVEKEKIPWWRVINSKGEISIKGSWTATKELQADLLRKEGVEVSKDMKVDMERYRYVVGSPLPRRGEGARRAGEVES